MTERRIVGLFSLPLLLNDSNAESHDRRRGAAVVFPLSPSLPLVSLFLFSALLDAPLEVGVGKRKIGRASC